MPLTPKDDISESGVEQEAKESDSESVDELRQRVADLEERTEMPFGLDTLDQLADAHQSRHEAIEDRLDTLESRVDQHEAVLHEVIHLIEVLGSAADWNDVEAATERVETEGSDSYPWMWDRDTLDFKAQRFE